ncbi:hypothetical protein CSQ29_003740 [Salmonella enterica subsp. diarizonae]|nr:hypothetical protein [Salmonella enterica subsp. diarizonae]EEE1378045.1 hypothetical protein [Salmonella enterica subsp. diarizonae]
MLYSSMYSFLTTFLRDELRRYEMKNPRNCVNFIFHSISDDIVEMQLNGVRQ